MVFGPLFSLFLSRLSLVAGILSFNLDILLFASFLQQDFILLWVRICPVVSLVVVKKNCVFCFASRFILRDLALIFDLVFLACVGNRTVKNFLLVICFFDV